MNKAVLTAVARFYSFVFNPNVCQYFIYLYMRREVSGGVAALAALFLFALPLLGYVIYVRVVLKRQNLYVLERNKRYIPFLLNIVSVLAFYLTQRAADLNAGEPVAQSAYEFLILINLLAFAITLFWRISIHMLAAAAAFVLVWQTPPPPAGWILALLFITLGLVGWSRPYLRAHTVPQVLGGTAVGAVCAWGFLHYFMPV